MSQDKKKHRGRKLDPSVQESRLKAWELRKLGMSYREIGKQIGKSYMTVSRYLHRTFEELDKRQVEIAEMTRRLELSRIDDLWLRLQPMLADKNPMVRLAAYDKAMNLMKRRAKLLGLDAPQQIIQPPGAPTEFRISFSQIGGNPQATADQAAKPDPQA